MQINSFEDSCFSGLLLYWTLKVNYFKVLDVISSDLASG